MRLYRRHFQSYEVLVIDDASDDISELTKIIETIQQLLQFELLSRALKRMPLSPGI